jgi:transcriptional regulator with XRE-family HTH domain
MLDRELINNIRTIKQERGYTLNELSRIIDVQVSTLERWLKTSRINKLYARLVREKLGIR